MFRMMSSSLKRFAEDFTIYYVGQRSVMPKEYSVWDMSEEYTTMVRDELEGPANVMGINVSMIGTAVLAPNATVSNPITRQP